MLSLPASSFAAAQQEVHVRGLLTKEWTSKSGKHHRGCAFTQFRLAALLGNVLYIGDVCHKGVVYPGEQPAIVERLTVGVGNFFAHQLSASSHQFSAPDAPLIRSCARAGPLSGLGSNCAVGIETLIVTSLAPGATA